MGGVVGSVAGVPIDERVVVKIPESVPVAVMSMVFFCYMKLLGRDFYYHP